MCTKIKSVFMVLILAGFTAQYAAAENFNQEDMAFAFGDSAVTSDFGQMDLLSSQEMMETEGEWWPLLIYGGRIAWGAYRLTRTSSYFRYHLARGMYGYGVYRGARKIDPYRR